MHDSGVMLWGELRCLSLLGVKGQTNYQSSSIGASAVHTAANPLSTLNLQVHQLIWDELFSNS